MKIYYSLLITLVLSGGVFSALTYFKNSSNKRVPAEPPMEVFYFNELFKSIIINESLELNNPMIYLGNDTTNKRNLFDLIDGKCLVFRFSGEACNVCTDFVISKLKITFSDFSVNKRILLIGSNINNRVKEKYYGKQIISFCTEGLGLPFEEYNVPFLFLVDRDRICQLFFIPDKSLSELTDNYLKSIKERYF